MKYTSNNKPLVCMQTQSACYKETEKMAIKGVLWHSTGANNPMLKRYVQPSDTKPAADTYAKAKWLEVLGTNTNKNDWNHIYIEAGLNYWIGKLADGTVAAVQTMPDNYRPWGCGSGSKGSCNDGWIQFEICEDALTDKTYFNAVYKEACELTAYLCKIHNLNPTGTTTHKGVAVPVILCHADSYSLGLGSNHGDVLHWFKKHGKTMADVRKDVAALIGTSPAPAEVKTYKVITTINKYSSASDAKAQTNSKGTFAEGTYYIYNKYPNGSNGMYNISTDSTGNSAGSWINPAENVKKETTVVEELYRIRTSWDNVKSQKGAYKSLDSAKACCQDAGSGYHVFDSAGKIVYSYIAPVLITLSSISVSAFPTKTTYTVGESLNLEGMIVTAKYSDGSTKTIVGYSYTGYNKDKVGTQTISITFEGKATTFTVTVKEKEEASEPKKVYELDYPTKQLIVDRNISRTNTDCVKAIKKIKSNNPSFDIEIAKTFFTVAPIYGIDPMMAIAQSILETGWFKYEGSAVEPEHHNYCGLGVTVLGKPGNIFETIDEGVTAQLQHLYAYGTTNAIPPEEKLVDVRFKYVTRGIAPYWQQLAGRWACPGYNTTKYDTPEAAMKDGGTYGQRIRSIFEQLDSMVVTEEDIEKYFDKDNDVSPDPVEPEVDPASPEVDPYDPIEPGDNNDNDEKVESIINIIIKILEKLFAKLVEVFKRNN